MCREKSVEKLDAFEGRITVVPGATDDREVIRAAVAGCDGVLVVLVPRGVHGYSTGTAQAVLDYARSGCAPRLLVRMAHHPRRPGRVLVEAQGAREGLRPARAPRSLRGPRRPGGGVPAGVRERHPVDRRARERPRGGREPGPAGVEPARGRPRSSRATSRAAWTSPCSWWRPSRTTSSSTRPRRSSAARRPRRSRTPPAQAPIATTSASVSDGRRAPLMAPERRLRSERRDVGRPELLRRLPRPAGRPRPHEVRLQNGDCTTEIFQ